MTPDEPRIVLTDPTPMPRAQKDPRCPQCRAGKEQRVASCGFGVAHDVCGRCGYEFLEDA